MNRTLVYSGKVIAIEPADEETAAFLVQLACLAEKSCGFGVMEPRKPRATYPALDFIRKRSACELRHPLDEDRHRFRYTVLTKKQEVSP